jgi:hypothetical protein
MIEFTIFQDKKSVFRIDASNLSPKNKQKETAFQDSLISIIYSYFCFANL